MFGPGVERALARYKKPSRAPLGGALVGGARPGNIRPRRRARPRPLQETFAGAAGGAHAGGLLPGNHQPLRSDRTGGHRLRRRRQGSHPRAARRRSHRAARETPEHHLGDAMNDAAVIALVRSQLYGVLARGFTGPPHTLAAWQEQYRGAEELAAAVEKFPDGAALAAALRALKRARAAVGTEDALNELRGQGL